MADREDASAASATPADAVRRGRRRVPRWVAALAGVVVLGAVGAWLVVTGGEPLTSGWISMPPRADVEMVLVRGVDGDPDVAIVAHDPDAPPRLRFLQSISNDLPVAITLLAADLPEGPPCGPHLEEARVFRLVPGRGADEGLLESVDDLPLRLAPLESAMIVLDLSIGCTGGSTWPPYADGTYASRAGVDVRLRALGRPRTVRVPTDHAVGWTTAPLDTISFDPEATVTLLPPQLP